MKCFQLNKIITIIDTKDFLDEHFSAALRAKTAANAKWKCYKTILSGRVTHCKDAA